MKLRFEVNQAEALRRGIDCPKSIVTVEVIPAKLSQDQRDLLADRMTGIDVYKIARQRHGEEYQGGRIEAKLPTFESLMEAVLENEKERQAASARAASASVSA